MGWVSDILGTTRNTFRVKLATFSASALTAARTYTLQNRSGTIADDTDLAAKAALAGSAAQDFSTKDLTASGNIRGHHVAAYNDAIAFDAFGNSITWNGTQGGGASDAAHSYISLLAAYRGWTVTNHGVSASLVGDQADAVFAISVSAGQQSTVMLGTCEISTWGSNAAKQAAFFAGYAAELAFLAIPEANKLRGQSASITYAGTWTNDTKYGSTVKKTVVDASTATFTLYGTSCYICILLEHGATGGMGLTIDGISYGSFASDLSADITTYLGRAYMPYLIRVAGLSEGPHACVLTQANAGGTPTGYLAWAAGNLGVNSKAGPNVFAANIPRQTSARYASDAVGGSDAVVGIYNAAIRESVAQLALDGLNVALIDVCAMVDPLTTIDSGGVHPNDAGHAAISEAFLLGINQIAQPRADKNQRKALTARDSLTIGATLNTARVTISDNAGAKLPGSLVAGTMMHLVGADTSASQATMLIDSFGAGTVFAGRASAGTSAAPSAVQSGVTIASFFAYGYGATSYSAAPRGVARFVAGANWSDSSHPTQWEIQTTPVGSTARSTRQKVDPSGNVISLAGVANQGKSRQVPTTGFSITVADGTLSLRLKPAGTLATGTIIMPPTPVDGQRVEASSTQIITALTVSANTGQTINNAPTTLAAGAGFGYEYDLTNTEWLRIF